MERPRYFERSHRKHAILFALLLLVGLLSPKILAADIDSGALKAQAYEASRANKLSDAADRFQQYLQQKPQDTRAASDYAGVLLQLNRPADAAKVLESIHQQQPDNESAYFKLGETLVQLQRYAQAESVFAALEKSKNQDIATAATAALRNVRKEIAREYKTKTERRIYELAAEFKHGEVIDLITELEKHSPLTFPMQMQRLYAMQALGMYAPALREADKMTEAYPQAPDLALLRADLLTQLGRRPEAEAIWRKLQRERVGTNPGLIATERLKGGTQPGASQADLVFSLASRQKYQEVLTAINKMEQAGKLPWAMEMQRLYAWQALGETKPALDRLQILSRTYPASNELAFLRADLLTSKHEWESAARVLKHVKDENPNTPVAKQATERLESLPPVANIDKWYWGEAYVSGDYLGRFGTVIGSGFIRHGFYIQNLRWLQPYAEMRFSADTRSGVRERSLITDNFVGFYGGVRAQLLPTEYLFVYAQGGVSIDLLERRHDGDWANDYQVGIYGFKSWGPGTILLSRAPGEEISATGSLPATVHKSGKTELEPARTNLFFWRGDWFVDAGADFSYYDRFSSWIGYGQAHEGFRLFQIGPRAAVDAYLVENMSWDVRGNYFDNLFEIGPGARLLWVPRKHWEVVLRAEYLNGFYFGRDDLHNRGGASGNYDDFRVALSVGARW